MKNLDTERNLLAQSRTGDLAAWGQLVTRYKCDVFWIALHTLRTPADAADAAQQTFIRAFRALPTFRGDTQFSIWLYKIATHVCKARSRRERFISSWRRIKPLIGCREVAQTVAQEEGAQALHDALRQLAQRYRLPLVLRCYLNLDHEAIAGILQVSPSRVKTRLHEGKGRLVRILDAGRSEQPPGQSKEGQRAVLEPSSIRSFIRP
jgi:RNA polymerase sigma-70 factor (ECF subfamily)